MQHILFAKLLECIVHLIPKIFAFYNVVAEVRNKIYDCHLEDGYINPIMVDDHAIFLP